MKIGVISDTHGLFDDSVAKIFRGADAIIHAGDIGKMEVIERLEQIAPVIAVEGNNDWFDQFPTERLEEMAGLRVMIRHIFGEIDQLGETEKEIIERLHPNAVVFGHSHRPYREMFDGALLFNPGSAGPRRFNLPRTVGLLLIEESKIEAEIISLD